MAKLTNAFYQSGHVTDVAKKLLGKVLCTEIDGQLTEGIIVETEAYSGENDCACHANNGRRTKRNEAMYAQGGVAYVYFCYGMHVMLNVVTGKQDKAAAVLIRAIEPISGVNFMKLRKGSDVFLKMSSGPGNVCKALGVKLSHNFTSLNSNELWIEDRGEIVSDVVEKPRIGVAYAGQDALLPWRYYIKGNAWVSKL